MLRAMPRMTSNLSCGITLPPEGAQRSVSDPANKHNRQVVQVGQPMRHMQLTDQDFHFRQGTIECEENVNDGQCMYSGLERG